ncbi:MAG: RNA polymerase sigma factor [Candidatus Baltobacteraceae bacterium]
MPLTLESKFIEDARAGGDGLERLISLVWPEAYRIALSILQDRGLAEDAAQDACVSIARSLAKLQNAKVFRSWSYRIIVNHAITTARRRPQTQSLDTVSDEGVHFNDPQSLDLYNALARLPLRQRAAIVLHYYGGLNSKDIAGATGLPSSTIRFHLMLARRALREALSATQTQAALSSKEILSDVH